MQWKKVWTKFLIWDALLWFFFITTKTPNSFIFYFQYTILTTTNLLFSVFGVFILLFRVYGAAQQEYIPQAAPACQSFNTLSSLWGCATRTTRSIYTTVSRFNTLSSLWGCATLPLFNLVVAGVWGVCFPEDLKFAQNCVNKLWTTKTFSSIYLLLIPLYQQFTGFVNFCRRIGGFTSKNSSAQMDKTLL